MGEIDFKQSCAGCHGLNGQGSSGPQLANSYFNDFVSDDVLYHWISRGRDGTPMKGFLTQEQGITPLTSNQIVDIIAYIRYLGKLDEQPLAKAVGGNPTLGEELFTGNCASCHGVKGEGASGPQLNNPSFLNSASDGFLAATMVLGRRNTAMRSMVHSMEGLGQIETDQVQDIIAYLRMWEYPDSYGGHRPIVEMNETVVNMGKELFTMNCIGCHGPNGLGERDGKEFFAPALNNTDFLNAASDGFLMATIAKGRAGTPMRAFGKGAGGISQLTTEEIGNIVSFIRSWNMRNIKNSE